MALIIGLALAGALALASPPLANAAAAAPQDAIIVEGARSPKKTMENFIDRLTPSAALGQLGRFDEPICPHMVNFSDGEKAAMAERMRRVAEAVKIPAAKPGCSPNLYLVAVTDKKQMIEELRKKDPSFFYNVSRERANQLANAPTPVAAWQVVDEIGRDGMPMHRDFDGIRHLFSTSPPSRVVLPTRPYFLGGIVIVEARALRNVTPVQLADYALMRALAPTDTTHDAALPAESILNLFDAGVTPEAARQSVTWWDIAFIKALYRSHNDKVASFQRHEMRERMESELAKAPADRQ